MLGPYEPFWDVLSVATVGDPNSHFDIFSAKSEMELATEVEFSLEKDYGPPSNF